MGQAANVFASTVSRSVLHDRALAVQREFGSARTDHRLARNALPEHLGLQGMAARDQLRSVAFTETRRSLKGAAYNG